MAVFIRRLNKEKSAPSSGKSCRLASVRSLNESVPGSLHSVAGGPQVLCVEESDRAQYTSRKKNDRAHELQNTAYRDADPGGHRSRVEVKAVTVHRMNPQGRELRPHEATRQRLKSARGRTSRWTSCPPAVRRERGTVAAGDHPSLSGMLTHFRGRRGDGRAWRACGLDEGRIGAGRLARRHPDSTTGLHGTREGLVLAAGPCRK